MRLHPKQMTTDNEEMLAKLEAGAAGVRPVEFTGNAVQTLIRKESWSSSTRGNCPTLPASTRPRQRLVRPGNY